MYIYEIRDLVCSFQFPKNLLAHYCLKLSFFFIFLVQNQESSAQFYLYGQDAGSIHWNDFSSVHYQLIYPQGLDSLAMDFADKLEYFYPYQSIVLKHQHAKLPVVFHNESSFSNGIFMWAPKRLEVFTNPDPNGYPQDWMTQLALHEGRHAFQVSKLNQGFTRGLSLIAGEQAVGIITGFLPLWYLEGDAVDAETRFSNSGRGRLPSFEMGMKAILLEKGESYSFSKSVLGSYKDYVPNHYQTGYLMVRYGRRTYGDSLWTDLEDFAARKPFLLTPNYFSMKKYGISSIKAFFNSSIELYATHWKKQYESRMVQENNRWNITSASYTSYNFPQWVEDSKIVALKTGVDQIPEFISIDTSGNEKRLFRPGYLNSGRFNYCKGKIIWDEWVADIRWSNRNYSVIKMFDIETGNVKHLGSRTRYYAPAFSKNGEKIVAIEQRPDHTFYLVVLDTEGNVIQSLRSPGNQFIQQAQWMEKDSALIVCLSNLSGEYLYAYSLKSNTWNEIYHADFNDISYPYVSGSEIYFSSTVSGIDNIFSFNMDSRELNMITSAEFGAFEPSVSERGDMLAFADYHSDGYHVATLEIVRQKYPGIQGEGFISEQLDAQQTAFEQQIVDSAALLEKGDYKPGPYRKLLNVVHIHSWLPLYFDYLNPEAALTPEELPVSIGATVVSQNLLSTVSGMVGYEFKDKTHYLHSGISMKGRYPMLDLSLNYGGAPIIDYINVSDIVGHKPNRFTFSADTYVPIRLNTGKFITFLQPNIGYEFSSDILPNENRTAYVSGIHKMHYRFYFSSYLRKGKKDILPRLGIASYAGYRNAPFNSYNFGSLSYSGITLYLPGILKHQALRLRYASQLQRPEHYFFNNLIPMPRGIEMILGLEMNYLSADYTFPLAYPDLNIGPFVYIKRIRGNFWIDYLRGRDIYLREPQPVYDDVNYYSYGGDLLFDFHPLRIFFPFSMGVRVSYVSQTEKLIPEFLFTIEVN